jgi:hypothetical protein
MRNGDNNLLILTLYIIGITYIFNQMIESIDDQIRIIFEKASVDEQLKAKNLQDKIGISFSLSTLYKIEDPKTLSINIENKSDNLAIYVEWDNCAFEEFDGVSRRVIRISPNVTRDLAVAQSTSLIVPKKTLKEQVAPESSIERNEAGIYEATKPVANILKWKDSKIKAQKKEFSKFMDRKRTFEFSLVLVLKLAETDVGVVQENNIPPLVVVKCPFTIKKQPWTYALPWNKKR